MIIFLSQVYVILIINLFFCAPYRRFNYSSWFLNPVVFTFQVIDLSTGEALGPNKEGEICAKGPLVMAGYLGDAVSTQLTVDPEGWLHTGDIGYYDEEHYFYIVDRLKELIKYKAFQVRSCGFFLIVS